MYLLLIPLPSPLVTTGQYMCFAENAHGIATSNSVFVRQSILNNFKEEPPITKTVEEGKPFTLPCEAPDGWPKPSVYWMIQVRRIFSVFSWTELRSWLLRNLTWLTC